MMYDPQVPEHMDGSLDFGLHTHDLRLEKEQHVIKIVI